MNYTCIDRVRPVSYQLAMETFEVERCLRGHHVFDTVWSPTVRERLYCAVAVMRLSAIVGHIPHSLVSVPSRRERNPRCRFSWSIQLSFWHKSYTVRTYVCANITNVRTHTRVDSWGRGLILAEFNLAIFSLHRQIAKLKPLPNFSRYTVP